MNQWSWSYGIPFSNTLQTLITEAYNDPFNKSVVTLYDEEVAPDILYRINFSNDTVTIIDKDDMVQGTFRLYRKSNTMETFGKKNKKKKKNKSRCKKTKCNHHQKKSKGKKK